MVPTSSRTAMRVQLDTGCRNEWFNVRRISLTCTCDVHPLNGCTGWRLLSGRYVRQVRGGPRVGCPSNKTEREACGASAGAAVSTIVWSCEAVVDAETTERFAPTWVHTVWSCAVGHDPGMCSLSTAVSVAISSRWSAGTATLRITRSAGSQAARAFRSALSLYLIVDQTNSHPSVASTKRSSAGSLRSYPLRLSRVA